MKEIIAIFVTLQCLSCSTRESKLSVKDTHSYQQICLRNLTNNEIECINTSDDYNKDIFELLTKTHLYNIVPDSGKYFGTPELVVTDTLGGGIIAYTENFYMDDYYYYQYEYEKKGVIKKYSFIDDIKPESCIEVSYEYNSGKLEKVLAINPHLFTSEGKDIPDDTIFEARDTLYTVELQYQNNVLLDQLKLIKRKDSLIYKVTYR